MGMTYTESYETRKAVSPITIGDVMYKWEYIIKSPIDGKANEVNGTVYRISDEQNIRLGYASYADDATSVRFDSANKVSIETQSALAEQLYADLVLIISE